VCAKLAGFAPLAVRSEKTMGMTGPALAVCGASDTGVVRQNNEDAFAVVDLTTGDVIDVSMQHTVVEPGERGVLLVVSDGMGGENAGEVASAIVVQSIRERLAMRLAYEGNPAGALESAVAYANERVIAAAREPGRNGMGATVVAVLIKGEFAYTAEIGDSRAYVLRGGALTRITRDQTYVQILLERGLLDAVTSEGSMVKNVVLQAVGKARQLVVAQRCLALRNGDLLLLCSDGLFAKATEADLEETLASHTFLDETCAELIELANDKGGVDNVTAITAVVGDPLELPKPDETVEASTITIREYAAPTGDP
jgi:serine/threonine protein phosphatase PrpC